MSNLNLSLTFHAEQPIFHGSDEDAGNIRTFRRERVLLDKTRELASTFKDDIDRREAILDVLEGLFVSIDFDDLDKNRTKNIWGEFIGKMRSAASFGSKECFIDRMCRAFQIESLRRPHLILVLDRFGHDEFLSVVYEQAQFLGVLLRCRRDVEREKRKGGDLFVEPVKEYTPAQTTVRTAYEGVPVVSGNSLRGILRRVGMRDYLERIELKRLNPEAYHQLFTGGVINKSTEWNDVGRRRAFIDVNPLIGVLGAAIGNQTIQGKLKMGGARLRCRENGTGELSWREMMDVTFQTRMDSSKLENELELDGIDSETHQMIYHHEVMVRGVKLDARLHLTNPTHMQEAAMFGALAAFLEAPFIGGNSARGFGLVETQAPGIEDLQEVCVRVAEPYYEYLETNKERIAGFYA